VAETERARCQALRWVHGFDASAKNFGDICGVGENQRDGSKHSRRNPLITRRLQSGDAEANEIQNNDERQTAEEVGIASRNRPQRKEHRAAQRADGRKDNAEHEHTESGEQEHPQVEQKAVPDSRQGLEGNLRAKEGSLHDRPAGCVDERDPRDDGKRGSADDGDEHRLGVLPPTNGPATELD